MVLPRIVILPSVKSFRTAAEATAHADEPDASVQPAPRSQTRTSTVSRARTRANCTLVRFGKAGCRSTSGPSRRTSPSSRRSTKTTQCGLPTDTAVTVRIVPATSRGMPIASRSGPFIGISDARKVARPISTVTAATRPFTTWHAHSTRPPWVSTVKTAVFACP